MATSRSGGRRGRSHGDDTGGLGIGAHREELEGSVEVLHQRGTRLHPVPGVAVEYPLDLAHSGPVHVPADHALHAPTHGLVSDGILEVTDILDSPLDLVLHVRR